ncbi:peritrophin-1-like [Anopheles bellator]|uniref:peritrophin-1-like n=1 Tax=Anopheles bellator TaxID=139047 RepID=UPI002649C8DA|nr:peritrophin-1-like [Anopheles bellator]
MEKLSLLLMVATICCTTAVADPCKEQGLYTGFLPHETDCSKYYSCYGGEAYLQECPDGKYFDPTRTVCDLEANVDCVTNNCPPDGIVFLPIPNVCDRYLICINGDAFEGVCDGDLFFDAVLGDCNLKNESGCLVNPCIQPPPSPPQLEIYPNPADCHQYLICSNGEPVVRECAPQLVFDPSSLQCVPGEECLPTEGTTTVNPGSTTTAAGATTDSSSTSDPTTTLDPTSSSDTTTTAATTTVAP